MIEFAHKLWLYLLPVAVVLLLLLFQIDRRGRRASIRRFASDRLVQNLLESYSPLRKRLKNLILLLAVCFLFLALARPQWGHTWTESRSRGIDIVFALDTSRSMLAQDIRPNRLIRAKLAIEDFVNQLEGDRIGLAAFAGSAFLQSPLTLDYDAFFQSLEAIDTNVISAAGTDLSAAIQESEAAFSSDNNYKIVILITDGEDLEGSGIAQARESAENGVTIYTVGVGTPEGAPIPIRSRTGRVEYVRDENGQVVQSRLEPETLEIIAESTGGFYVPLGTTGYGLEQVLEAGVGSIPEEEISSQLQRTAIERFQWPLGIALFLLALEPLIGTRRSRGLRRNPSAALTAAALLATALLTPDSDLSAQTNPPLSPGEGDRRQTTPQTNPPLSSGEGDRRQATPKTNPPLSPGEGDRRQAVEGSPSDSESTPFARAVASNASDPVANFNFATELYETGEYARASRFFTEALRLSNDFAFQADTFYNLGNTHYRQGSLSLTEPSPEEITETAAGVSGENQPPMQMGRRILEMARSQPPQPQQIQQTIAALEQRKTATTESTQALSTALEAEAAAQKLWQRSINDFESTLELAPGHDDARHNLDFVKKKASELAAQIAAQKRLKEDQERQVNEMERLIEELKKLLEDQQDQDQQEQEQNQEQQEQDQQQQEQQPDQEQQQEGQPGDEQQQNGQQQQEQQQEPSQSEQGQEQPENEEASSGDQSEADAESGDQAQQEPESGTEEDGASADQGEEGEEPATPEPGSEEGGEDPRQEGQAPDSETDAGEEQPESMQLSEEQAREIAEELAEGAEAAAEAGEEPAEGEEVVIGVMTRDDAARLLDSLKRSEKKLPFAGSGSQGSTDSDNRRNW